MSFEYTITVKDIYGTDTPAIPEGWELTGEFRPPKEGEYFLTSSGDGVYRSLRDYGSTLTRLILRRKKVRKVIFTETRRDSQPKAGEWYLDIGGRFAVWTSVDFRRESFPPTTIYRREEVEE